MINDRILSPEEITHIAAGVVHDNMQYCCRSCGAPVERRRAERRRSLRLAVLCDDCASANTREYMGADIGGELVKTDGSRHMATYIKGTHAIQ